MNGAGIPEMHQLYRETILQLERLSNAVAECKSLREAISFCRYLQWSGIIKLCEVNFHDPNDGVTLKCDGSHLRWRVGELEHSALEKLQYTRIKVPYAVSELESISNKLDLIAGQLVRGDKIRLRERKRPKLRVIKGGNPHG